MSGRTCVVVPENVVRGLLSRRDIFDIVRIAALRREVRNGPAISVQLSRHDIGVKIGSVEGGGFGLKVRAGAEGNYFSVAWNVDRRLMGLVESSYLTYCRTAAALLLPPTELSPTLNDVLILGSGPLGQATALLARDLHPESRIVLWSRTHRTLSRELDDKLDGWWVPDQRRVEHFDVVVTCTRSPVPLPLDGVDASYVSVGGAVDGRRRELSGNLLHDVSVVYADDPDQAARRCRDLDAVDNPPSILPLGSLVSEQQRPAGRILTVVCGSGGYDVLLANHVLMLVSSEEES